MDAYIHEEYVQRDMYLHLLSFLAPKNERINAMCLMH